MLERSKCYDPSLLSRKSTSNLWESRLQTLVFDRGIDLKDLSSLNCRVVFDRLSILMRPDVEDYKRIIRQRLLGAPDMDFVENFLNEFDLSSTNFTQDTLLPILTDALKMAITIGNKELFFHLLSLKDKSGQPILVPNQELLILAAIS